MNDPVAMSTLPSASEVNEYAACCYPISEQPFSQLPVLPFCAIPLYRFTTEFHNALVPNNFLKAAKWSPDGLCVIASTDDNMIRLFEVPLDGIDTQSDWQKCQSLRTVLTVKEGETIYDMEWYPGMVSLDPSTCCFFSTSRDTPVHVWDAFTGAARGMYSAYTDAEELDAAYSICFENTGSNKLYCGYNNCIRIYDIERPGREHSILRTHKRAHGQSTGQRGIISCAAFNPDKSGLFAAGSYSRNVALYDAHSGKLLYNLQVTWGPEGCYLYTGARMDDEILCWDVRQTGDVILRLPRAAPTNQRFPFSLDAAGRRLITPSQADPPQPTHAAAAGGGIGGESSESEEERQGAGGGMRDAVGGVRAGGCGGAGGGGGSGGGAAAAADLRNVRRRAGRGHAAPGSGGSRTPAAAAAGGAEGMRGNVGGAAAAAAAAAAAVAAAGVPWGELRTYDVTTGDVIATVALPTGALNGVNLHPARPAFVASAGRRRFDLPFERAVGGGPAAGGGGGGGDGWLEPAMFVGLLEPQVVK